MAEENEFIEFSDDDWSLLSPTHELKLGSKTIYIKPFDPDELKVILDSYRDVIFNVRTLLGTIYEISTLEPGIKAEKDKKKLAEYKDLTEKRDSLIETILGRLAGMFKDFPQLFSSVTKIKQKDLERMSPANMALILDAVLQLNLREGSALIKNLGALTVSAMNVVSLITSTNQTGTAVE